MAERKKRTGQAAKGARIASAKNRRVQIVQPGGRKLFDKAMKTEFLEWFAATANIAFAARVTGIAYQTVFKHRMSDPAFAEGWDRALAQGYARVEAQSVETKIDPDTFDIDGDWEVPEMQERDPMERIALLRQHRGSVPGKGGDGPSPFGVARKQGRQPRTASNEEVRAALVKRLVVFGVRFEPPAPGTQAG